MHILDAVFVQNSLCNFLKRTLTMVKVWLINMLCFFLYMFKRFALVDECRVALIMLCLEDSFNTFILTEEDVKQNEHGQGQE